MKSIEVGRNPLTSQLVPRVRNRDGVTIQTNNKAKSRFLFTSEDVVGKKSATGTAVWEVIDSEKVGVNTPLFHTEQR